mgnify:CR=1 FL=1
MSIFERLRDVAKDPARPITCLIYGETKVGKTHFISTFPGPILVLAIAAERGSDPTLRAAGRDDIRVIDIVGPEGHPTGENQASMAEILDEAPGLVEEGGFKTVALDTATLYAQRCVSQYSNYGQQALGFEGWGKLAQHFMNIRDTFHSLPTHFIWTAHVKAERDEEAIVTLRADLPGSSYGNIAKGCNIIGYLDRTQKEILVGEGKTQRKDFKTIHRLWVKCPPTADPAFSVGTHFDEVFVKSVYNPSFTTLKKYLVDEQKVPLIAA